MEVSELRLGNFIYPINHYRPNDLPGYARWGAIKEINGNNIKCHGWHELPIEAYIPIVISTPWLDALSFENGRFILNEGTDDHVWIDVHIEHDHPEEPVWVIKKNNQFISNVSFVHELQNAFFMITGKDLGFNNMKSSDLRVGNLVLWNDNSTVTIEDIKPNRIAGKSDNGVLNSLLSSKNFKGISLNEEWLLKLGFSVSEQGSDLEKYGNRGEIEKIYEISIETHIIHNMFNMSDLLIAKMKDGYRLIRIGANYYEQEDVYLISNVFEYVHQLQNLYFALVGKELQIINTGNR